MKVLFFCPVWKKLIFWTLVVAAAAALIRILRPKPDFEAPAGPAEWPPLDLVGPEDSAEPAESPASWVESGADGSCPDGYPVKVKLSSGIFHVPGGMNYERTRPDRCYVSAASAEADGFRQSQR